MEQVRSITFKEEGMESRLPLKGYDGKKCRIFLANGYCVVGQVEVCDEQWLKITMDSRRSCTVNTSQIITIGEM